MNDERDQPHEVLRREEAGEREEAGDRRGERNCESPSGVATTAQVDPRHGHNRQHLRDGAQRGERVRQRADQVVGDRVTCAMHHRRVVEAEPVGHREQRAAEALDLEGARSLRAKALDQSVRRNDEKRDDEERRDRCEGCECARGERAIRHFARRRSTPAAGERPGRPWRRTPRRAARALPRSARRRAGRAPRA